MVYNVLDIEENVSAPGYEEGTYPMIIAVNVLHATKDLDNTMENMRELLRPGGYLLINERTTTSMMGFFPFFSLVGGLQTLGEAPTRVHYCHRKNGMSYSPCYWI
jgi:hypothetical protein